MAATPLQQTRMRKIVYFIVIIALFTVSLIHREWILKPQAIALQLQETSRGEVELTSSAVRLMLTGSRGLAVTALWYTAMEKQKRHEWHEFEMVVKSITKLQPYFITPWLYQSWNLSFNVAVECDRPRDKYYYISRGLELLSEGERRNRGMGDESVADDTKSVFPGHPELRHHMGFTYQLKLGTSDERLTMRSLLELSCIDPAERHPERFLTTNDKGDQVVKMKEFSAFCDKYPRLVRRLREQLSYADPLDIVKFLKDHQEIPSRFESVEKIKLTEHAKADLKPALQQFPIMPPPSANRKWRPWPDPKNRDFTAESVDVFLVCRIWYEFAQNPLPDPDPNPTGGVQEYDKVRFRIPKGMVTQLFRQYPARAQVYIAETLESEGYFDSDGWDVSEWFNAHGAPDAVIGREQKYHSREAWRQGWEMYRDFGIKNGIYLTPGQIAEFHEKAAAFRKVAQAGFDIMPPMRPEWRQGVIGDSFKAHEKLYYMGYYRRLSNFDAFFDQAEGEQDAVTVATRKLLFYAERRRKLGVPTELTLRMYEQAWPLYVHACLKYPRFGQVSSMQEDFYEVYQQYLGATQKVHSELFKSKSLLNAKLPFAPYPTEVNDPSPEQLDLLVATLAHWPISTWREALARHVLVTEKAKDQQVMNRVANIKKRTGPLDRVQYWDSPVGNEVREAVFLWSQGAQVWMNPNLTGTTTYPGHHYHLLTRLSSDLEEPQPESHWRPLINPGTRSITANRLGLDR
jgi:hypothetical protein